MVRVAMSGWSSAAGESASAISGDEGAADSGGKGAGFAADVHRLRLAAQHQRDDARVARELADLLDRDVLAVVQHALPDLGGKVLVAHGQGEGDRLAAVFGQLI